MEILYLISSLMVLLLLLRVAAWIKPGKYLQVKVFMYLLGAAVSAAVHYRIFISGQLFGWQIGGALMIDLFALVMLIVFCTVPVWYLNRKLNH
ncbi:MAG: hypothetical protein HOL98_08480 [Gammaproteobacteria bacterium]|nr:hypothetical protein [Gammaproteobacteria bacterium]MBT5203475.1 hypothetical protein [Gammaproteobacteria bacterium]MBT5601262.1 hypothetical protein [Gammaproteobacteria bacterium]MBT6245691.1 hypothetical protein [Gammaproteobacteria bacterium]